MCGYRVPFSEKNEHVEKIILLEDEDTADPVAEVFPFFPLGAFYTNSGARIGAEYCISFQFKAWDVPRKGTRRRVEIEMMVKMMVKLSTLASLQTTRMPQILKSLGKKASSQKKKKPS